jgi:hypothetical protein
MKGDTMNPTPDTAAAGNGGSLDPRQAAALLDETTFSARRQLEPYPPWLLVTRGFGALVVYGGIWLSVLGQHPYAHPTAAAVPGAIAFGVVNTIATFAVAKRATAGVTGRTKLRPAEYAAAVALWIGVFAVMGVLIGTGVRDSVTYGLYPACVPLIAAGVSFAAIMAVRADWRRFTEALTIAVVGIAGLFAGPAGAWLVAGVGICVVLLGTAAVVARRQRA